MTMKTLDLNALKTGLNTAFKEGLKPTGNTEDYKKVATVTRSDSDTTNYPWLGKITGLKEWIGNRALDKLKVSGFALKNILYEDTLEIPVTELEDNKIASYGDAARLLGANAAAHPNQLVFALLKKGWTIKGYDGKTFFLVNRNTDGGSGTPWFLLDASKALKPLIFQVRKNYMTTSLTSDTGDTRFMRNMYLFGVEARVAAGFGLPQFAWGSKQTLNAENYAKGRQKLMAMKGQSGVPIGVMPNLLVVPPALEQKAREVVGNERTDAGKSNPWYKTAEILVTPYLA